VHGAARARDPAAQPARLFAVECLAVLSSFDARTRAELLRQGAGAALVGALRAEARGPAEPAAVGPAAVALLNLAVTDDDARLALVREGAGAALGAAAQLPAAHGTDAQLQAVRALVALSACTRSVDAVDALVNGEARCVPLLLALARAPQLRGGPQQLAALEALVNLSAGGGRTERAFVAEGAVEQLVALAEEWAGREQGAWAVKILANLSQAPEVRPELKAKGALQALAKAARNERAPTAGRPPSGPLKGGDDVAALAAAALSNLAVG